jgi:hypothetical protein
MAPDHSSETCYGFCFRPVSDRPGCSGSLHLWVSRRGKTLFVPTPYDVDHAEWDAVGGTLVIPGEPSPRGDQLSDYAQNMVRDLELMGRIIGNLKRSHRTVDIRDVVKIYSLAAYYPITT